MSGIGGIDDAALLQAVTGVVRQTYRDVHRRELQHGIDRGSTLDRDLDFDSLARVELVLRLERAFAVHLPDSVLETAETVGDLMRLLRAARPGRVPETVPAARLAVDDAVQAAPPEVGTLIETLDWHVRQHAERVHLHCVTDPLDDAGTTTIRYGELREKAGRVAAGLQVRGLQPGQTVAIMLPTGPDYFHAYFGVLLAGCVPVPIYPPFRRAQIEEHVRRHAGILDNAQTALLITVAQARAVAQLLSARLPQLLQVATVDELAAPGPRRVPVAVGPDDIAFIQYTSGSTGNPKGVVLTHANLLANIRAFSSAAEITADSVLVSWLPLYHDMGLIGTWLNSLYNGVPLVVMSPLAFLARPERWLWAIHRYRGTHTVAPNFAYALCLKRIDDVQLHGLDLSSLRVVANGSEQVLADTLERFQQRFGPCGLDPRALMPVYGLAECTVGLLVPPLGQGPRFDRVRRTVFVREGRAEPAPAEDPNPLRFACCGRPLPGHEVRIVDADGAAVGERTEGRLEFRGPSATRGYYRSPELSRALFHGDWLDSGDRAYVADGQYYLTGRIKDIVIRGGRNIYPDELEEAVGAVEGVRRGCVVAFGCSDPATGTERLVVLAETRETDAAKRARLHAAIVDAVVTRLGEPPDEVVLAPPKTVLKTSSGKLRRAATRERYLSGQLERMPGAVAWQILRLSSGAIAPLLARALNTLAGTIYAAYVWLLFALAAAPVWLLVALTRTPAQAWAIARRAVRMLLGLSATRLVVEGLQHLPRDGPCVLVVNHASYLDGLVLMAALPGHYRFVAKRELLQPLIARVFLRRLGCAFVERFAIQQSVDDARRLAEDVRGGDSLIVFPEGTFVAAAALLPFHLGAFVVAARTGAAVVPVAIRGTRTMLRAGSWRPRRGSVVVTVGAPIGAAAGTGDVFAAAVSLRDRARAQILVHCGEADGGESAANPDAARLPRP